MITLHDAIRALNPSIAIIRGEDAFDENENPMSYDMAAAQTKLLELQEAEQSAQEAEAATKQTALAKLTKLGLTADEIKALIG